MRYFTPELSLGDLLPPQTDLQDKYGGLPWGFPTEKWPLCNECGKPLSHLATLVHDAERLDLGKPGRAVLVFQCTNPATHCETMAAGYGANAVVFLNAEEIGEGLTPAPEPGALMEIEARVLAWTAQEDAITPEQVPYFYDSDAFWKFWDEQSEQSEEVAERLEKSISGHKIGSVPAWVQGADDVPAPPYRFVAQFADHFEFSGPPPEADQTRAAFSTFDEKAMQWTKRESTNPDPNLRGDLYISDITQQRGENAFDAEAADFGDGGIGYLFVDTSDPNNPKGRFSWQCG